MDISRTGVTLNTENYDACVSFYQKIFGLPVMFKKNNGNFRLTCFKFGGSYLMIETEGIAKPVGKSIAENAAKLRFNVKDIDKTLQRLKYHAIEDRNSPMLEQLVLSRFIEDGHFGRHLRKMRLTYQERQESLVSEFKKSLSGIGDIRFSPAGLHLVTHLKKEFADHTIYKRALKKDVIVQPLSMYSMKRKDLNGLVMGFSAFNSGLIKKSISKLSTLFQ